MNKEQERQYKCHMEQITMSAEKKREIRALLAQQEQDGGVGMKNDTMNHEEIKNKEIKNKDINSIEIKQGEIERLYVTLSKQPSKTKRLIQAGGCIVAAAVAIVVVAFLDSRGGGSMPGALSSIPIETEAPDNDGTELPTPGKIQPTASSIVGIDVSGESEATITSMLDAELGVAAPDIIYVNDSYIYLAHYSGFLIYDKKQEKVIKALDTKKYDSNHTQGSDFTEIKVLENGEQICFTNMETSDGMMYRWDVERMQLYSEPKQVSSTHSNWIQVNEKNTPITKWMQQNYSDLYAYYWVEDSRMAYFGQLDPSDFNKEKLKDYDFTVYEVAFHTNKKTGELDADVHKDVKLYHIYN